MPERPPLLLDPIGIIRSPFAWPCDAPRQGHEGGADAVIELHPGRGFETALAGLAGFERLWVLALFDRNRAWKPLVHPPRYEGPALGVFATRSPHRPNPLALSCVRLTRTVGRTLHVAECDLLDGTPVLDLKPYLPYADAFPGARCGWVETRTGQAWAVRFSDEAATRLAWLAGHGFPALEGFLRRELSWKPDEGKRKRVRALPSPGPGGEPARTLYEIAYRTWRAIFFIERERDSVLVETVTSGYRDEELLRGCEDRYADKETHRAFRLVFPRNST